MVYRVYIVREILTDADSWEEAVENAFDENFFCCDEYLDDERNSTDGGEEGEMWDEE